MRTITLLAALLAFACGVSFDVQQHHRDEWQRFNEAAGSFSAVDGIDRGEAELLGGAYFLRKFGACGVPGDARDAGTEWRMRPLVGVGAVPADDEIRVDKRTGAVSYASDPPVSAEALLEGERKRLQEELRDPAGRSAAENT